MKLHRVSRWAAPSAAPVRRASVVVRSPSSSFSGGASDAGAGAGAWREMFRRPSEADADAWRCEQPLTVVAGTVPEGICGTYYKNGPAWSGADDEHPLDGEGFVWALRFRGDGRVTFRAAAVETDHVLAERRQGGRRLRPGAFGGAGAAGAGAAGASVKNVANTNVVPWGDDLLAFYEAGAPYVLDPDTLRTEGRFLSFRDGLPVTSGNGAVDATMRLLGKWGDAVSAHPKVVAAAAVGDDDAARLVLATLKYSLTRGANARTDVTFTEIDASGAIVQQRTVTVGGFAYFHDFAVTESRYIFFQAPLTIDWDAVGARGIAQSMRQLGGEPTQIHSVARATGAHTVVPFGGGVGGVGGVGGGSFVFHHAYARDAPGDAGAGAAARTVIASVHYPEYAVPGEAGAAAAVRGELRELTVDWREGAVTAVRRMARGGWLEFPVYDAAGARVFATAEWTPGGGPQQAVVSVETASAGAPAHYWTRAGCFFGEPFLIGTEWVAAPCRRVAGVEGAEGAAMLLLLWRADRLVEGPIAEIALPPGVPMGLHGTWASGSGGDDGECFGADSDTE